ncbi:MAG: adenylate/guanylate cyclase domain-containing protein [Verrucomicrobia bacterium]|nr:adenylate/guanylate cyclase domain-containing protein [Verrucomicrobiota bacterium]
MRVKWIASAFVAVAALMAAFAMEAAGWLERPEYVAWSWRVRAGARPSPATDRIRVILIDQPSLDWARRENKLPWPWPREVYGPILDFCNRAGARSVAFDMIFTEPSFAGVADDEALGAAVARTEALAAGIFASEAGDEASTAWPAGVPRPWQSFAGLAEWLLAGGGGDTGVVAHSASFPIPEVATNALVLGNVRDVPDADGVFRSVSLFRVFDREAVPSLGIAAWLASARIREEPAGLAVKGATLTAGGRDVPIDGAGRAILRFRGPSGTHKAYGASGIIQSELRLAEGATNPVVDPADFCDKYVFIGASAPGLMDLRPTPISRVYPGVEIHATALDNLLAGDFIRAFPIAASVAAAAVFSLLLALSAVFGRKAWHLGVALAAAFLLPLAAGFALYEAGWWFPVVPQTFAAALAVAGGALYNYSTEGRQKAFIKQAFRQYLGPAVIDQILEDPSRLRLGGERRDLTIFFSDIEKFSSFSEKLDPTELTALLNEYLTEMGQVILGEGGYVDKYIGDAIVAFWNAPVGQEDHARRAIRTGLNCQRRLAARRAEWQERFGATVKMRVGLNTGAVVVGNMGSDERFNYTILGDAANLASRLEGANKAFGSYFMAADATRQAAGDGFVWRRLGRLLVVGRHTPVAVFEPLGPADTPSPPWLAAYHAALDAFEAGRFEEAGAAFRAIPDDAVAARHADRCARLLASPPEAWDGVIELTEK